MKRILIMGLPGAGKTYLAQHVLEHLQNNRKTVMWLNADDVRKKYNDWDFSHEGRIRQSLRMRELADSYDVDYVICDFVAPLVEMRNNFKADWTIWMDTIDAGDLGYCKFLKFKCAAKRTCDAWVEGGPITNENQ